MFSHDQSFSNRASVFWAHHRLLVEQLAGVAGQCPFGFELAMHCWWRQVPRRPPSGDFEDDRTHQKFSGVLAENPHL